MAPDQWLMTVDTDWAPEWIRAELWEIFSRHGVKSTVFATDPVPELRGSGHEICVHPQIAGDPAIEPLDHFRREVAQKIELVEPNGEGLRVHGLKAPPYLGQVCADFGIRWTSNGWAELQNDLEPRANGPVVDLPLYYSDNAWLKGAGTNFDSLGMKVFLIHPVHVYLNTLSQQHYQNTKKHHWDRRALEGFINTEKTGVRGFLEGFLAQNAGRFDLTAGRFLAGYADNGVMR